MRTIVCIAHDMRSTHNVGSLLRTCEGLGVATVFLTGYTPYPLKETDTRLPHLAQKIHKQIVKTALGAEHSQRWEQHDDVVDILKKLKREGYTMAAIEQTAVSAPLPDFKTPEKVALLFGREVEGLDRELLQYCDVVLEIPMFGQKESFNVVQAAAISLYHCRFID